MPNGRTHDIISIVFLPIILVVLYYYSFTMNTMIIISIGFLFSSFMFNGDLDIHSQTYRRWLFLKWYWLPYRRMIPHRSIFSHGIIIGTIIRLLYVAPLIYIVMYFYPFSLFNTTFYTLCIGLELGSALHTICDKLF